MADYFRKTDRGRREVRERSVNLPRAARNLLLILDSSKSLGVWIGMINGATVADAVALLEAGLIEAQVGPGGPETRPAAFEPTEPMGHDRWLLDTAPVRLGSPTASAAQSAAGRAGATDFGANVVTRPAPLTPATTASVNAAVRAAANAQAGAAFADSAPPAGVPAQHAAPFGAQGPMNASIPVLRRRLNDAAAPEHRQADPRATPSRPMPLSAPPAADSELPSLLPDEFSGFVPLDASGLPAGSSGLSYTELYDSLNALLRETLGLFRGYRYTLRIERAENIAELEAVAREFVLEVKRLRGESMGRMVQRALGLGG